ncbi:LuxR C-terminal-related transcriptional regulator [Microbacterium maritypicum]
MSSEHAESLLVAAAESVLEDLLARGLGCAPRVVARLLALLDGDDDTIRAVVARLSPDERAGTRPLPRPLPLVPELLARFAELDLPSDERSLLLAAAVSEDDALGPLLAACGPGAERTLDSSAHLRVHAGRFRFVERRLALWVWTTSSPHTVTDAHRRLASAHSDAGDAVLAAWHRARSSVGGDAVSAGILLRAARELADVGASERAVLFASEAAAHTEGADHSAARLTAGVSAVGAGHMAEAVGWLAAVCPSADESTRLHGLAALLVAHAHLQGAVPDASRLRPRGDAPDDWHAWTRAAAFGAALCAERGDRTGARTWIDALRDGAERTGSARRLRDPVVSLVWLLLGEGDPADVEGTGAVTGVVLGALRRALAGDLASGLQILATGESGVLDQDDPFISGFEHSDLISAHRVVVEVLLRVWAGDIAGARSRLCEEALVLPLSVPFAGLGVVLARRLDLAVLGTLGPFARSLTVALPSASRIDQLVDRALRAHLAGEPNEAASCLRLWLDRGGPQLALSVPGLDEEAPVGVDPASLVRHRVEPPEMQLGRLLRWRAVSSVDAVWRSEAAEVTEVARSISSPFERARVEAAIGNRALVDDDPITARTHLLAARQLFDECGARAWADAVAQRWDGIAEENGGAAEVEAAIALRRGWANLLTPRELDVALMAVSGASNREIAAALTVSVRTVEVHLGRVFAKLGVRSRVELVLRGHRSARYG